MGFSKKLFVITPPPNTLFNPFQSDLCISYSIFIKFKIKITINMSLPTNDKKANSLQGKKNKTQAKGSKFMQSSTSKPLNAPKKVRSTGANRGS
jgi:hypothetical protein